MGFFSDLLGGVDKFTGSATGGLVGSIATGLS